MLFLSDDDVPFLGSSLLPAAVLRAAGVGSSIMIKFSIADGTDDLSQSVSRMESNMDVWSSIFSKDKQLDNVNIMMDDVIRFDQISNIVSATSSLVLLMVHWIGIFDQLYLMAFDGYASCFPRPLSTYRYLHKISYHLVRLNIPIKMI